MTRIDHDGVYCPACTENSTFPSLPKCDLYQNKKESMMFNRIFENIKPSESFHFMESLCSELARLEYLINHNKSKFLRGDESENEIWECILNILEHRISKK